MEECLSGFPGRYSITEVGRTMDPILQKSSVGSVRNAASGYDIDANTGKIVDFDVDIDD